MSTITLPKLPADSLARCHDDGKGRWTRSYKQSDEARFLADVEAWRTELAAWERADMAERCAAKQPPRPKRWPTSAAAAEVLAHVRRLARDEDARWSYYAKGAPAFKGRPAMPGRVLEVVAADGSPIFLGDVTAAAEHFGLTVAKAPAKPRKVRDLIRAGVAVPDVPAEGDRPDPAGTVERTLARRVAAEVVEEVPAPTVQAADEAEAVTSSNVEEVPTIELDDIAHQAPGQMPSLLGDYLARLLHEPKRRFAADLAAHLLDGAPAPEVPAADWAPKVAAKVRRYAVAA